MKIKIKSVASGAAAIAVISVFSLGMLQNGMPTSKALTEKPTGPEYKKVEAKLNSSVPIPFRNDQRVAVKVSSEHSGRAMESLQKVPQNNYETDFKKVSRSTMEPNTVFIPSLGLYSALDNVWVSDGKDFLAPSDPSLVGIWVNSKKPHSLSGNTLLSVQPWNDNGDGIGLELENMHKGDSLFMSSDYGNSIHYKLVEKEVMDFSSKDFSEFGKGYERTVTVLSAGEKDYNKTNNNKLVAYTFAK